MGTLGDQIEGFDWLEEIIEKLAWMHNVQSEEVEECFFETPQKLLTLREQKYQLLSRSANGRYLFIVFVWIGRAVRVLSARDMTDKERNLYRRK